MIDICIPSGDQTGSDLFVCFYIIYFSFICVCLCTCKNMTVGCFLYSLLTYLLQIPVLFTSTLSSSCTWKYWPFPPIILHRTLYNIWQYTFPLIPPLFCLPLHILLSSFSPLFDSLFLKVLYRKSVSTLSSYEQYTVCPWCIVENQISGFVG